uniref:GP-PDE domain-containing protein n=1 Tax=Neobodo designis TaxID=312471 RepID=A0A7S1LDQ8_NEODS
MGCGASSDKKNETAAPGHFHNAWTEGHKRTLVLGHRGGSLKYPENTLEALQDAMAVGADGVEIDVMITKDGKLVAFHDENTERMTGESLVVAESTWEQLSQLRTRESVEYDVETLHYGARFPIPLVEDVLTHFKYPKGKAYEGIAESAKRPFLFNLELKPSTPLTSCDVGPAIAKLVEKLGMADQVVITSFDFAKLRRVEKTVPKLHSGWGYDDDVTKYLSSEPANKWYEEDDEVKKGIDAKQRHPTSGSAAFVQWLIECAAVDRLIGATVVAIEHTLIDDDTVKKFHDKGFAVGSYTLYPYDQAAVQRKLTDKQQLYEESERVLAQLVRRRVNWVETDDAAATVAAVAKLTRGDNA